MKPRGFTRTESDVVLMDESTRKEVLQTWQQRKQEEVQHSFLGESMAVGLFPHIQVLRLALSLRGDLEGNPALVWK